MNIKAKPGKTMKPGHPQWIEFCKRHINRCYAKNRWKVFQLISPDRLIYTVREKAGAERQVLTRDGVWTQVSKVQFSTLACYEEYHRDQYLSARPREESA